MMENLYKKIGFSEPPFIESGAAINVTPFLPEKLQKRLDATVEFALSGQFSPLILGGAAGSGKSTISRYYFNFEMFRKYGKRLDNAIVIQYTITDSSELRDVSIFYKHIIEETLNRIKQKETKLYDEALKQLNIKPQIETSDSKSLKELFRDLNVFLRSKLSLVVYVIDEIDYVVDLINEKDYTFVQHLRHIIDILSEIRFTVLVLSSTKLPASHIKGTLQQALGPAAARISESIELQYTEEDFLAFVRTRFQKPLIESRNGDFIERSIRLDSRLMLEREYNIYFPFTESGLRELYRKDKGTGLAVERLRNLERDLAKLTNIYCSQDYASTKGMTADKIFDSSDVDKFLTYEGATRVQATVSFLTPKEEQWFVDFFGFRTEQSDKFSQEKLVIAVTKSLAKYFEMKQNLPTNALLPSDDVEIKQSIKETKKGLKFFSHSKFAFCNIGFSVAVMRDNEIRTHGWDSLSEIIDDLYSSSPHPQKKVLLIFAEDDFEFAEISSKLAEQLSKKEKEAFANSIDTQNIDIINGKLLIKTANSFIVTFIKATNLIPAITLCTKSNRSEIIEIGDRYFLNINNAMDDWYVCPCDFVNYTPSTERLLQCTLLLPAIQGKYSTTERAIAQLFESIKMKGERYNFDDLTRNGFLRSIETEVFQICIPSTIAYLFATYKQFTKSQIYLEFGEGVGEEIIEFLRSFLGFTEQMDLLLLEKTDLKTEIDSALGSIKKYQSLSSSIETKQKIAILEKIQKLDYPAIDKKYGLKVVAKLSFMQILATRLVQAVNANFEQEIRKIKEQKKESKFSSVKQISDKQLAAQLNGEKTPESNEGNQSDDIERVLGFIEKPKTWAQLRNKFPEKEISDEELWQIIQVLHKKNQLLLRVKKR